MYDTPGLILEESSNKYDTLLELIINRGTEASSIFGDDYNTPNGSCLRDYIDVIDLARAHVVAISRLIEERNKRNNEVFNVGTGRHVSVFELVQGFEEANNLKPNCKVALRHAGDVMAVRICAFSRPRASINMILNEAIRILCSIHDHKRVNLAST